MILINLLPHREETRKRKKQEFTALLGGAALLGLAAAAGIYFLMQSQVEAQQARNTYLQAEIGKLDGQIKEIANIESEITALRARQKAVEDLQSDRNMPVHLLNEVVRQLPDGVYITSLKQEGQNILIQGMAQSNERISEMLRNFSSGTTWMNKPELVEIVSANVSLSPREQRRVGNFNMRVHLLNSSEVQKAQEPAAPNRPAEKPAEKPTEKPAEAGK